MQTELDFYNTNQTPAHELPERRARAGGQEEMIIKIFEIFRMLTPSQALSNIKSLYNKNPPITSVRRAIHTATKKGYLIKLGTTTKGPYNEPEHYWRIAQ